MKIYINLCLFIGLLLSDLRSQNWIQENLPGAAASLRFAGSTGLIATGYSRLTKHQKGEFGILYGHAPKHFGTPLHIISLHATYHPLSISLNERIMFEPVTAGAFISATFSKNLGLQWGEQYPPGYYWWNRNLRLHPCIGTQMTFLTDKKFPRDLTAYFELSTNDLYIASWFTNRGDFKFHNILVFAIGMKSTIR